MSSSRRPLVPKTLQLRADNPGQRISDVPHANTTDYELSESIVMPPAMQLKAGAAQVSDSVLPTTRIVMDDDARALFRHRLILCCAIAAGPFCFWRSVRARTSSNSSVGIPSDGLASAWRSPRS